MSQSTELFVYGTLRHDRPEHARYCRGVLGWRPARVRGRLFRIVEGYRLLVVPPAALLLRAGSDPAADEQHRLALGGCAIEQAAAALEAAGGVWLAGELLRFRDPREAWPPIDRWEGVSAAEPSVYARAVVPVHTDDADHPLVAAWIYASTRAPAGAVEISPFDPD